MNRTLVLRRRLRWHRVLPELLSSLQRKVMFWRHTPSLQWNWLTLILLALWLSIFCWAMAGHSGLLAWLIFYVIGKDLHDNALPIFACVRIRSDEITLGKIFTERHSLAEVQYYRISQANLPYHSIRFHLSEKYWPDCISFVVDEEDAATLVAYLQARGIGAVATVVEPVALEI